MKTIAYFGPREMPVYGIPSGKCKKVSENDIRPIIYQRYGQHMAVMDSHTRKLEYVGERVNLNTALTLLRPKEISSKIVRSRQDLWLVRNLTGNSTPVTPEELVETTVAQLTVPADIVVTEIEEAKEDITVIDTPVDINEDETEDPFEKYTTERIVSVVDQLNLPYALTMSREELIALLLEKVPDIMDNLEEIFGNG